MSESNSDNKPPRRRPSHPAGETPYRVGYKNPPREHRFKPGQSGNPAGKRKNKVFKLMVDPIMQMIHDEAHRPVTVREGSKTIRLSAIQAGLRNAMMKVARGDRLAIKDTLALLRIGQADHTSQKNELFKSAVEYKYDMERELIRRAEEGIDAPDPIPHPDHIIIYPRTGDVQFVGPLDENEKAKLESAKQSYEHLSALIQDREIDLTETHSPEEMKKIASWIKQLKRTLTRLDHSIASLDPTWKKNE
ncbi:DUF5681 domain-containing protein [Aestuariivirga sp.]|uniref:DUF5681 domain-containing protein n=1 Tax=Aestuariivirga sp. TaxID=2650926 RepID=UPI003BAC6281